MYKNHFGFPNWLAAEHRVTRTKTATDDLGCVTTLDDGRKVILSGSVFPNNDATAEGIAFNFVDVSDGLSKPIAVMVEGYVYASRLPEPIDATAVLPEIKQVEYNETEV